MQNQHLTTIILCYFLLVPFTLIGFINREKLFCTSDDLFESFQDETTFCTAGGTHTELVNSILTIILKSTHLQVLFSLMVRHSWDTGWLFMPLVSAGELSFRFIFGG